MSNCDSLLLLGSLLGKLSTLSPLKKQKKFFLHKRQSHLKKKKFNLIFAFHIFSKQLILRNINKKH